MHHKMQSRVIDVAVICKKKENVTEVGNTDMYFDVVVKGARLHVLENSIQEEIKSRLNSGNACYLSVQDLLSSSLLSKNTKIKIYRTIVLPVVLYGCETWSLTLREEHRLRVSENRVLRKIFGPKRDEVTGEWGRLHNEELNDLYSSPNIIRLSKSRRMRWVGHVGISHYIDKIK
jgi:hypothetical protein